MAIAKAMTTIHTPQYSLHRSAKEKLDKQTQYAKLQKDMVLRSFGEEIRTPAADYLVGTVKFSDNQSVAAFSQGTRLVMEDSLSSISWGDFTLDIVCDGHGDSRQAASMVSEGLKPKLEAYLPAQADEIAITNALTRSCVEFDQEYHGKGGTTVTGVLIHQGKLYFFNVGDSRSALIRPDGTIDYMSLDAKPDHPLFLRALKKEKMNYLVHQGEKIARVFCRGIANGCAVAREIGLKGLSPRPKFAWADCETGSIIILATDGFWDVMTKERVKQVLFEGFKVGDDFRTLAEDLVRMALEIDPSDNITVFLRSIS